MRRPVSFPTPVAIPQLRAEAGDWIYIDPSDPETPVSVVSHIQRGEVEGFLATADAVSPLVAHLAAALTPQPPHECESRGDHLHLL